MLSHEERRRLDAIGEDLERADPDLARHLKELREPPRTLLARLALPALLVFGLLGLFTGILIGDAAVFLVTGLVPAVVGAWLIRRRRRGLPGRPR